jgi:hypothetical protein
MKFKMAATAELSFYIGHYGKNVSKCFFSETTGFPIGIKNTYFVEDLPMIIPGQFGFNYPSGFREEAF